MSTRHGRIVATKPGAAHSSDTLTISITIPEWMDHGLCLEVGDGDSIFFPEKGSTGAAARRVCGGCFVREPCLAYALEHGMAGMWGGTSERERARMKQEAA
jgi:WhiB family redox-sensing transcriptional regulator